MIRPRSLICLLASALLTGSALAVPDDAGAAAPPPDAPPLHTIGVVPTNLHEIDLGKADLPLPLRLNYDDIVKLTVMGYPELTQMVRVQRDGTVTLPLIGEVAAVQRTLAELRDEVTQRLATAAAPLGTGLVAVEDVLRMEVWRQQGLTYSAAVTLDGNVTLPLVGEVPAAHRTLSQIRVDVRQRLSKYLRDPQVSILMEKQVQRYAIVNPRVSILPEKLRERTVVLVGEVAVPGMLPMYGNLRVLDAISAAHYNDRDAALNDVIVIRDANTASPQYKKLHIADYLAGTAPDQNIFLKPDDIVFVPKTQIAKVGEFVDQFFSRTKPVFDWWVSLNQARYAEQYNKGIIEVYRRLNLINGATP